MVTPRPILKSLPLYTPDMTKHTRIARFASLDSDPDVDDREDESNYEQGPVEGYATPATPALPFASTAHVPPFSPHVHFPPTPILTQMAMTHSSRSYDRKPIQVQPNELALPARGERDVGSDSDAEAEADDDAEGEARTHASSSSGSGARRKALANGSDDYDQGYFQLPTRSYDMEVMDSMDAELEQDMEQGLSFFSEINSPRNSSSSRSSSQCSSPTLASTSKPSLRSKARPQTPYHHTSAFSSRASRFEPFLPAPPPLVFDPSSESDSDLCISPSSGQSPDQVSHVSQISMHLAGFASELALEHDRDRDHDGVVPTYSPALQSSLLIRKRADDRHLPPRGTHANGDGLAKRRLKSCGSNKRARMAGSSEAGHRTSKSSSTLSGSRFGSSFYEGSLDGCLGGF